MPLEGVAKKIAEYLKSLGFTGYESKVYLTLVIKGALNPTDIANLSGVPRPNVYRVLDALEKEGYVIKEAVHRRKYSAVPLDEIIKRFEEKIERNKEIIEKLKRDIKHLTPAELTTSTENVWLINEVNEIKTIIKSILANANRTLIILAPNRLHEEKSFSMNEVIKILSEKLSEGVEVIFGTRISEKNQGLFQNLMGKISLYNWVLGEIPVGVYSRDGEECLVTFIGKWAPIIIYDLGLWIKNPAYVKSFEYLTEKLLTLNTPVR